MLRLCSHVGDAVRLGQSSSCEVSAVPRVKRERRERTHNWQQIRQLTLFEEQKLYEKIRPVVLFGETSAKRAKEIGESERTIAYQAVNHFALWAKIRGLGGRHDGS